MQTYATVFPGAHCACCSWEFKQSNYYLDILLSAVLLITIIVLIIIISLKYRVIIAFTLEMLQHLAWLSIRIKAAAQVPINRLWTYMIYAFYKPFMQSMLDLQRTVRVLVCDDPHYIRAKFHLHETHCDMWMDYTIVANCLWKMNDTYSKYPKINSIKDLWKHLDGVGNRKACGYEKLIGNLKDSLEEISSFHLGHDSILELLANDSCLMESEDYKCNAKIQKIIKENLDDFAEMINIDELQPIMEGKQLLSSYDIASLNQKTGLFKVHYILTELLSNKGHRGYIIFVECLDEEKNHHGHQTIVKMINSKLKDCNMCRPRKYLLRELYMWYRPKGFLSTVEYFEASERFMYLCQTDSNGSRLDCEIHQFVVSHKKAPEAVAVGFLMQTLRYKFQNNFEKLKGMGSKIEECISQIRHAENRSVIKGNWYLTLSCWNRHQGKFQEAKELLKKAKGELFTLACGDDRAKILYNEASLLIEENNKLGTVEEKQVLTLLQDAMTCFRHKPEGLSIMQARCLLKKAHCHIGCNLRSFHKIHRPSHLKEAYSILVILKKQFNSMPVRLQMQYYIVECDYNRTIGKKSEATACLQKGLDLHGSKKFKRDLTYLKERESYS